MISDPDNKARLEQLQSIQQTKKRKMYHKPTQADTQKPKKKQEEKKEETEKNNV